MHQIYQRYMYYAYIDSKTVQQSKCTSILAVDNSLIVNFVCNFIHRDLALAFQIPIHILQPYHNTLHHYDIMYLVKLLVFHYSTEHVLQYVLSIARPLR